MIKDKFLRKLYNYNELNKAYHVVIDLENYRDAYSDWDYSPMNNRDLDEDLFEYLMECSYEIGLSRKMAIDFYIPREIANEEREKKSKTGFRHYFSYQIRKINNERYDKFKTTVTLFTIGFVFLFFANYLDGRIHYPVVDEFIKEGLFIGAWVAIWEVFSALFFDVKKLTNKIKHYRRLKEIEIRYQFK